MRLSSDINARSILAILRVIQATHVVTGASSTLSGGPIQFLPVAKCETGVSLFASRDFALRLWVSVLEKMMMFDMKESPIFNSLFSSLTPISWVREVKPIWRFARSFTREPSHPEAVVFFQAWKISVRTTASPFKQNILYFTGSLRYTAFEGSLC